MPVDVATVTFLEQHVTRELEPPSFERFRRIAQRRVQATTTLIKEKNVPTLFNLPYYWPQLFLQGLDTFLDTVREAALLFVRMVKYV